MGMRAKVAMHGGNTCRAMRENEGSGLVFLLMDGVGDDRWLDKYIMKSGGING